MKSALFASALAVVGAAAIAAPEKYVLDSGHSQILFSYDHIGFSTSRGMFGGFTGEIEFDAENPAASSVSVSIPTTSMITGWDARFEHFMSPDFFDADDSEMVTFTSTSIEVTGADTALITGDLMLNGVTKPVTLDARLNKAATHPMAGKPWLGFDASTTLLRSDYGLGLFAPAVGDEVKVEISIEAAKAD